VIPEGWYLMSTADLEEMLGAWRAGRESLPESARRLTQEAAMAYRRAGNLPDEQDRSLRLLLRVETETDLKSLDAKRLVFEPDYLDAPSWRRAGSRPVNVVPLRSAHVRGAPQPWFEEPALAELEGEWRATGTVGGVFVPGEYRSFVFKTVLALRSAGREVTAKTIADGITRWLPEEEAHRIREALELGSGSSP
jgi:hypothetical protein